MTAPGCCLVLGLTSSEETLRQYPWASTRSWRSRWQAAGSRWTSTWRNRDTRPLPLHLGYHPYFRVPQGNKAKARVETDATHAWDNRAKHEVPFTGLDLTAQEVDMHLRDHSAPGTVLERGPGLSPVKLSWSQEFRLLVVWTLQGKDFVCVEPWTAAAGALATGGLLHVAPGGACRSRSTSGAARASGVRGEGGSSGPRTAGEVFHFTGPVGVKRVKRESSTSRPTRASSRASGAPRQGGCRGRRACCSRPRGPCRRCPGP